MGKIPITWKRTTEFQIHSHYVIGKSSVPGSPCALAGYYSFRGQESWCCLPQTNISFTLGKVLWGLSIHRGPNFRDQQAGNPNSVMSSKMRLPWLFRHFSWMAFWFTVMPTTRAMFPKVGTLQREGELLFPLEELWPLLLWRAGISGDRWWDLV